MADIETVRRASKEAREATKKARSAKGSDSARLHSEAANAHSVAAMQARHVGDHDRAAEHEAAVKHHDKMASAADKKPAAGPLKPRGSAGTDAAASKTLTPPPPKPDAAAQAAKRASFIDSLRGRSAVPKASGLQPEMDAHTAADTKSIDAKVASDKAKQSGSLKDHAAAVAAHDSAAAAHEALGNKDKAAAHKKAAQDHVDASLDAHAASKAPPAADKPVQPDTGPHPSKGGAPREPVKDAQKVGEKMDQGKLVQPDTGPHPSKAPAGKPPTGGADKPAGQYDHRVVMRAAAAGNLHEVHEDRLHRVAAAGGKNGEHAKGELQRRGITPRHEQQAAGTGVKSAGGDQTAGLARLGAAKGASAGDAGGWQTGARGGQYRQMGAHKVYRHGDK